MAMLQKRMSGRDDPFPGRASGGAGRSCLLAGQPLAAGDRTPTARACRIGTAVGAGRSGAALPGHGLRRCAGRGCGLRWRAGSRRRMRAISGSGPIGAGAPLVPARAAGAACAERGRGRASSMRWATASGRWRRRRSRRARCWGLSVSLARAAGRGDPPTPWIRASTCCCWTAAPASARPGAELGGAPDLTILRDAVAILRHLGPRGGDRPRLFRRRALPAPMRRR